MSPNNMGSQKNFKFQKMMLNLGCVNFLAIFFLTQNLKICQKNFGILIYSLFQVTQTFLKSKFEGLSISKQNHKFLIWFVVE